MLNPPISHLSDDLLAYIVEHIGNPKPHFPGSDTEKTLRDLSLADRAFTQSCQKSIFRELRLADKREIISKRLERLKIILDDNPFFVNHVRLVELPNNCAWLFDDPIFISILQLLSNSPVPPQEIRFGHMELTRFWSIRNPVFVVRSLTQSFFSQTLRVLYLEDCEDIPLLLFFICPRLREVSLEDCFGKESYDEYPANLCSDREPPSLEVFASRNVDSVVEEMIIPLPKFNRPAVHWSSLRVLTLCPQEEETITCLQPILDAACSALEELYLTTRKWNGWWDPQLPLAGLLNLCNLPNLRVFALYAKVIKCDKPAFPAHLIPVLHDINIVLGTIPKSNKVANLWFDFTIIGQHPFGDCLERDWAGMFKEVIRISDGKPLELELMMEVFWESASQIEHPGQEDLFTHIMEKAKSALAGYPNICTHFWNPTFSNRGLGSFPRGQVRGRCNS
ncbi:hypothetical protein M413DRAFT_159898 [Hebeloma cylindrosporum]|uniref:F-box domain-containing protein n=1 Tax=Hebeloma cylindrosporum TaxID=76867 RepID=A0A0C3BX60_HEBCY|nr:hypothetical protein M413DRAFT_159898 [Hebeloma cylindrosporum h7]